MSNFIHVSKIVQITYKLTDAAKHNGEFKIYATELATSIIQERQKRFYPNSAQMVVDIISYFDDITRGKYHIFVDEIKYTNWIKLFEPGEKEVVIIKLQKNTNHE